MIGIGCAVYTESFSPFQFLSTYGYHQGYMPQTPNMQFVYYAEDINGNRIDTLRSAQVTLISDNIEIELTGSEDDAIINFYD